MKQIISSNKKKVTKFVFFMVLFRKLKNLGEIINNNTWRSGNK